MRHYLHKHLENLQSSSPSQARPDSGHGQEQKRILISLGVLGSQVEKCNEQYNDRTQRQRQMGVVTLNGSRAGVILQGLSGIGLEEMCRTFIILLDLSKLKLKQESNSR